MAIVNLSRRSIIRKKKRQAVQQSHLKECSIGRRTRTRKQEPMMLQTEMVGERLSDAVEVKSISDTASITVARELSKKRYPNQRGQ
jgi:hypothetical protein